MLVRKPWVPGCHGRRRGFVPARARRWWPRDGGFGGRPRSLRQTGFGREAKAGDPLAVEILLEAGRWLGVGLADLDQSVPAGDGVDRRLGGGRERILDWHAVRPRKCGTGSCRDERTGLRLIPAGVGGRGRPDRSGGPWPSKGRWAPDRLGGVVLKSDVSLAIIYYGEGVLSGFAQETGEGGESKCVYMP